MTRLLLPVGKKRVLLDIDPRDHIGQRMVARSDWYEKDLLDNMAGMRPGVAVDVGAHIGVHTLWLAALGWRVYSVEPNPAVLPYLQRHRKINRFQHKIDILPYALGAASGQANLENKSQTNTGSAYLVPSPQGKIPVKRLDGLNLPKVNLIKIDVEGMEADVLRGGSTIIQQDHPVIYAEEWTQDRHDVIASILEPWGYTLTKIFNSKSTPTPVGRWDYCG